MSFLIDFDTPDSKLKELESSLGKIADQATSISTALQSMSSEARNSGSGFKKLKDEVEKSTKSSKKSVQSLKDSIKDLSGANGKAAQKIAVDNITLAATYKKMVASVKGEQQSLIDHTKETAKKLIDTSAKIRAAQEARTQLNVKGAADAELKTWQKGLSVQRSILATQEARTQLNVKGAADAELKTWQKGLSVQREIRAAQEARTQLNLKGAAEAELKTWQKGLSVQREIRAAQEARTQLNLKGAAEAELKTWQKGLSVQRSILAAQEARKQLNLKGTAEAELKTWQKGLAAQRAAQAGGLTGSAAAAQGSAALRASLNAAGASMGIYTGKTILMASAMYGAVSAFKAMVTSGIDFTREMARALPIMGATAEQSKLLELEVRRLGATTKFTATEAAGGLVALAMAGLSASQALEALSPALTLASIGQIDMYKSADILTNVMNGFRLTATDIPKIVDDLATAVTSSNATIEQMATALSYVAPVAAAAGGSIEEVTAILQVFHNAGIKASRAGTALRRAYSNLMSPSAKAAGIIAELGIATKNSNGYMLEMSNIMNQLADNGAIASDIIALFGVRAAPAMLALLQDMKGVSSEFEIFRANLEANEGAAKDLSKSIEKHLGDDLKKLMSALNDQAISLYKELESGFRSAAQAATEFIRSISAEDVRAIANSLKFLGSALLEIGDFALLAGKVWLTVKAVKALAVAFAFYKKLGGFTGALIAIQAALTGYTAKTVLATAATRTFGVTLGAVVGPIGWVLTALGVAYVAYDHYSSSASTAAEATRELTRAQKDQAALASSGSNLAKQVIKFAKSGGVAEKDPIKDRINKELIQLKEASKKIAYAKNIVAKQMAEGFTSGAPVESMKVYGAALDVLSNKAEDTAKQIADAQFELVRYSLTGMDEQGRRQLERDLASQAKSLEVSFTDAIKGTISELKLNLKTLGAEYKSGKANAAEIFLGSETQIQTAREAINAEFSRRKAMLEDLSRSSGQQTTEQGELGGFKDIDKYSAAQEDLVKLTREHELAISSLDASRISAQKGMSTYSEKNSDLIEKGKARVETLRAEIAKIKGEEYALKSATQMSIEAAIAKNKLNIATLDGADAHDAETERLKAEQVELKLLLTDINKLTEAKKGVKDLAKIKEDYESGKGLAPEDKAQKEYESGLAQLEAYAAFKGEQYRLDEEYANAKKALDIQLFESQNSMWVNIQDATTSAISSNLTQAIMMQESWKDTGKNIKEAIYGSIISSLVAAGTEMASTALMSLFFKDKEVASETAKGAAITATTAASTAAAAVQTTVMGGTAIAAIAASSAISSALVIAGGLVATAWTLPAYLVTLASAGENAVPAIAGMESAALAAIGINATVSASALSGREIGGPVSAGQSYIVGERGAEIFTPTTSGAITSNADVKRGLGGGSGQVVNNYNTYNTENNYIDAIDTESFQQRLAKQGPLINSLNSRQNNRRGKR